MAQQKGIFKFTGRIDNVIGYRRKGVYCVRTMPETVRQTAATRRAARSFGMASRKGKLIRRALCPYMDTRHDGSYVNRLTKELILAGSHNLQCINGFRFNKHAAAGDMFLLPPVLTADGQVHIPAQDLRELELAKGKATRLEVTVIAARVNFSEHRVVNTNAVTEMIDLTIPFNGITFHVPAPGKGTLILAIQVRTCDECNGKLCAVGGRRYMAADIISVIPPYEPVSKEIRRNDIRRNSGLISSLIARPHAKRSSASVLTSPQATRSSASVLASLRATGSSASVIARPFGPCAEPGRSNLLPPITTCKLE